MAISQVEYSFLSWVSQKNILPPVPNVLEFGEQHWHGDIPVEILKNDILNQVKDNGQREKLLQDVELICQQKDKKKSFDLAKVAYKIFLDYRSISAIDLHGTDDAFQFDLNEPVEMEQNFDVTINFGTGEHIFNVYQFFKTMHELTAPGGIMLHGMPFLGWLDHGFFNYQPTFYWDLAESNDYQIVSFLCPISSLKMVEVNDKAEVYRCIQNIISQEQAALISSNLYVAFKQSSTPKKFQVPRQNFFQVSKEEYWSGIREDWAVDNSIADELNLKEINLVIFPDWTQFEEAVIFSLEETIRTIGSHPDKDKMALLVDVSNYSNELELSPENLLSAILLNLLLKENLDIANEGPEISLLEELSEENWNSLLPRIHYRIILSKENTEMLAKPPINLIESCDLNHLSPLLSTLI